RRMQIEQLSQTIATITSNLLTLEEQIAVYGGEAVAPLHLLNQKRAAERDLARAQAALERLRAGPIAERAPYVGLSTFQERDSALFFGREALLEELVAKVQRERFLAVLGPSGSGKSSVVLAGLLPALKEGALEGSATWRYLILKPGPRPLNALAVAL